MSAASVPKPYAHPIAPVIMRRPKTLDTRWNRQHPWRCELPAKREI